MENLKEETTCHIEALKSHDFGGTLNNINGGLVSQSESFFTALLLYLHVSHFGLFGTMDIGMSGIPRRLARRSNKNAS